MSPSRTWIRTIGSLGVMSLIPWVVSSCSSIGTGSASGQGQTFDLHWTSTQPNFPAAATTANWSRMSCVTPKSCVAVGTDVEGPVAAKWDGRLWKLMSNLQEGGGTFNAISCPSPQFCMAVGTSGGAGEYPALAEALMDGQWTQTPLPAVRGANILDDVSCLSPSFCLAVGFAYVEQGNATQPIALSWDGRMWSACLLCLPRGGVSSCVLFGRHFLHDYWR